ncbi:MAG: hypothetical protein M9932_11265 [Xanthobacteraceae bacterium]|nr:hypothetical protein [Xanthobacteraceae bacterium]
MPLDFSPLPAHIGVAADNTVGFAAQKWGAGANRWETCNFGLLVRNIPVWTGEAPLAPRTSFCVSGTGALAVGLLSAPLAVVLDVSRFNLEAAAAVLRKVRPCRAAQ